MKNKLALPDHIVSILKAGIQAPSGDNCQPWAFKIDGNYIDLYLRPEVDRSFFNFRQLASVISCGAVLENMRCEAARLGYMLDFEVDGSGDFSKPIAKMHIEKSRARPDDLITLSKVIYKRCTNRKMYDRRPIPAEHLEQLKREVERIPGCELHLFTDRKDIFRWARLVYMADRLRTERRDLHEHLMSMIRWTDEEAREKRDGLPLKNLEAGLAGELFLRATRSWKVMRVCNAVGLSRLVAFHSFRQVLNSSAIGLVLGSNFQQRNFFFAGSAFETAWLLSEANGIAFQPMAALTLFLLRIELQAEWNFFSYNEKRLLGNVQKKFFQLVSREMGLSYLLFRLGYSDRPDIRTKRKSLECFCAF